MRLKIPKSVQVTLYKNLVVTLCRRRLPCQRIYRERVWMILIWLLFSQVSKGKTWHVKVCTIVILWCKTFFKGVCNVCKINLKIPVLIKKQSCDYWVRRYELKFFTISVGTHTPGFETNAGQGASAPKSCFWPAESSAGRPNRPA